jgi:diketogulonate reductase-like aldo/keto reductase
VGKQSVPDLTECRTRRCHLRPAMQDGLRLVAHARAYQLAECLGKLCSNKVHEAIFVHFEVWHHESRSFSADLRS